MLRVKHIPGENVRVYVEGNSFRCTECPARFLKREHSMMKEGMECPKCHKGKIDERWHIVDVSSYDLNGACSCEFFSFDIAPKVKKMSRAQRLTYPKRCSHIEIARSFVLDVTLSLHVWEQHKGKPIDPENEI